MPTDYEIAEQYSMKTEEYQVMRGKIVKLHREIEAEENIEHAEVYRRIENISASKKEAIMITSAICALSWGIL